MDQQKINEALKVVRLMLKHFLQNENKNGSKACKRTARHKPTVTAKK